MSLFHRSTALLLTTCMMLAVSAPVQAQTKKEKKQAKALYKKGIKLYKKSKYEKALEAFKGAHEIVPETGNLYNIARCLHELGRMKEAVEYYDKYIAQEGPRKDKAEFLVDAIKQLPSKVTITTHPEGAEIFVDEEWEPAGTSPVIIDIAPGKHRVTAKLEGHQDGMRVVVISYANSYSFTINLEETRPAVTFEDEPRDVGPEAEAVHSERPGMLSHLVLLGGGVAVPILMASQPVSASIDVSWEVFLPRSFGIGVGLDVQISSIGQLFAPHVFAAYTVSLPAGFHLFVRLGVGALAANIPSWRLSDPQAVPADLLLAFGLGAGWSRRGFTIRLDAVPFYLIPGLGGIGRGVSAEYVPQLLVGYRFSPATG
jgi:hypothetical protein